jgi:hypothetical protein
MAMPKLKSLSAPNKDWGICGFVSVLAALYDSNPALKKKLKNITEADFSTRLLADIKTFLMMLKADSKKKAMLKEIEAFTKKFEKGFTLDGFIAQVNNAVDEIPDDLSLAMTPPALLEYLKTNWGITGTFHKGDPGDKNNVILGFYDKAGDDDDHLKHWVYKKDADNTYNWGEKKKLDAVIKECKSRGAGVIDGYIQLA